MARKLNPADFGSAYEYEAAKRQSRKDSYESRKHRQTGRGRQFDELGSEHQVTLNAF